MISFIVEKIYIKDITKYMLIIYSQMNQIFPNLIYDFGP